MLREPQTSNLEPIIYNKEESNCMKRVISGSLILLIASFLLPATSYSAIIIDIGNPLSEAGYTLTGWGPIEPATHGGNWGGYSNFDGTCRVISSNMDGQSAADREWASLSLPFDIVGMQIIHLEGIAKDSFYVYADSLVTTPVFYYAGDNQTNEYWVTSSFAFANPTDTVYFLSDRPHWWGWETYGQVAISEITVEPVPEPASMILFSIGALGFGFVRKKI